MEGLLRGKTLKPGKLPLSVETITKVLALPCGPVAGEATHWTSRMAVKAVGISLSSVQRIWRCHHLQPHRLRTCKKSKDPSTVAVASRDTGDAANPANSAIRPWTRHETCEAPTRPFLSAPSYKL